MKNATKWRVRGPIKYCECFEGSENTRGGDGSAWNMDKIGRRPQKEASRRINRSARNTRDVWFNKKSPFIGGWGGNRVAASPRRNKFSSFHEAIKRDARTPRGALLPRFRSKTFLRNKDFFFLIRPCFTITMTMSGHFFLSSKIRLDHRSLLHPTISILDFLQDPWSLSWFFFCSLEDHSVKAVIWSSWMILEKRLQIFVEENKRNFFFKFESLRYLVKHSQVLRVFIRERSVQSDIQLFYYTFTYITRFLLSRVLFSRE